MSNFESTAVSDIGGSSGVKGAQIPSDKPSPRKGGKGGKQTRTFHHGTHYNHNGDGYREQGDPHHSSFQGGQFHGGARQEGGN